MQSITGFSHQFLSTGTCASCPQKLQFLCSINQNIFISNRSFKTIMNKIPTQSLTFLTCPFIFCTKHFIPEQPSEQLINGKVYFVSTVHELCQWLQWVSSNRKTTGGRWFFTPFSPYPDTWRLIFPFIGSCSFWQCLQASLIPKHHKLVCLTMLPGARQGRFLRGSCSSPRSDSKILSRSLSVPLPAPGEQRGTGHQPRELCTQTTAVRPDLRTGLQGADKNHN